MNLFDYFSSFKNVNKVLASSKIELAKSSDGFNMMLVATDFYKGDKTVFVILPTLYQAQMYYDQLVSIIDEEDVLFFPADELISAEMIAATGDFLYERIQTLYTLLLGEKKLVITNMHGAIKYEMNKERWKDSFFLLKKGDIVEPKALCSKLIELGYEPTFTTDKTGQFSKRGSIVDIFPLGSLAPIRLDFFDDEIDSIKEFNIETQRSIKELDKALILPVTEFIYGDDDLRIAKNKISAFIDSYELSAIEDEMYKKDIYNLDEHKSLDNMSKYIPFFDVQAETILDFVDNKRVYIIDKYKCKECYDSLILDLNDYCTRLGGYSLAHMKLFKEFPLIEGMCDINIMGLRGISDGALEINAKDIVPYNANQKEIVKDFKDLKDRKRLIISIDNEDRFNKLSELLDDNKIRINPIDDLSKVTLGFVNRIKGSYPSFELESEGFILINEATIFDYEYKRKRAKYKSIYKNAVKVSRYDELVIGDYVVHYDYGVGKYIGIDTLNMSGLDRDFIHVMYANNSALYIPLEKISNLMKYASADTEGVVLNDIGGTAWARAKARVKKRVHDISDKLIALYALRQKSEGFPCPEDMPEQIDFESDFEYDLTVDQAKAVEDIKRDMESKKPMDRLVCGDVGYGKTEVAMRAAFKMILSGGKQVAVLAPTTILARQHYLNFKARMEKYGVRCEMLTRMVPKKQQNVIVDDLLKGSVDIIIGTHRLLSTEIKYKDLGLLIVDEEQRFGVTHKEKIKALKVNVDCITLSATPIPRTLQMSVMGIKDLSMIETPPKNRYPIQTYVIERNDRIITDAIERELARGGQVFYLYNWTETIEQEAAKIKALVPEARVCVGHGKLSKDKLEDILTKYINKEYNVLICTTIIETGIDMPDTNTLIVHDADRLGLSQMYQIRGRVGRSNKIAYAYLMYEPRKKLTAQAEKRLATIKEFNELGSGFKIAMRDLTIRGAGDLLGEEQSGFVESVGIDMYLKILDEEINKKEEAIKAKIPDKSLTVALTNRTIKKSYVDNDDARISIHKKIDKLKSIQDLDELIKELTDRFGKVDNDLLMYMYEKLTMSYYDRLGIYRIDRSSPLVWKFYMNYEMSKRVDGKLIYTEAFKTKYTNIHYENFEYIISIETLKKDKLQIFKDACNYFDKICS